MKKSILFLLFIILYSGLKAQDQNNYQYALIEANRQKTIGNIDEAVKLYRSCISTKPESAIAYYELGSIHAAYDNIDRARSLFEKAYELDTDNYWVIRAYVKILEISEDSKLAIRIIKKYLRKKEDTELKYALAVNYQKQGKNNKALKVLDEIEKNKGLSEKIILKRVEIFKEKENFKKGKNELKRLSEIVPESPEYQILMAEFIEEIEGVENALYYYKEAYRLDTNNVYAITNLADYYNNNENFENGLFYLNKAFQLPQIQLEKKLNTLLYYIKEDQLLEKYQQQIGILVNTLLDIYSNNYDLQTIAFDYYNKTNQTKKSYQVIKGLLDEKRDNYLLWQQAIYSASVLGKYDDILEMSQEAKKIFPNKDDLSLFHGIALFQKNDYQSAYDVLISSYSEDLPVDVKLQFLTFIAESAYKLEYVDKAFETFEEILLIDNTNLVVKNNYSYYLSVTERNLKRAMVLSEETIMAEPDNATFLDTYGWILFKKELYTESEKYLKKAVQMAPENAEILFHYSELLKALEKRELAEYYFKKALDAGYEK